MRTTKTLTISLSPEQFEAAEALAKLEHRSMSELFREALRFYQQERLHQKIQENRARMAGLGITEEDIVPIIKEWRQRKREQEVAPGHTDRNV